jgi:hypothetical protein
MTRASFREGEIGHSIDFNLSVVLFSGGLFAKYPLVANLLAVHSLSIDIRDNSSFRGGTWIS